MLLAIKQLFTGEAAEIPFAFSLDLSTMELGGVLPFVSPVRVSGRAFRNAEGVHLTADAAFDFCVPCDRCAEEIHTREEYRFDHELVLELHQEDNEKYLLAEQDELDLSELITEDILLELPTKHLCKPDCKGLCPTCGANLNSGSCSCEKSRVDPRMEILKQLIED